MQNQNRFDYIQKKAEIFSHYTDLFQDHSKCIFNGNCEINTLNRHICSSCRLAKCFASGMQVEMLRSSRPTKNRTRAKRKAAKTSTISTDFKKSDQTISVRDYF